MEIDRPIFFMGPGRSGTTLVYNIFSFHEDLTYFSNWTARFPHHPWLAVMSRGRSSLAFLGGKRIRGMPAPAEAYAIWRHCFPDFWGQNDKPCTDREGRRRLEHVIRTHLRYHGKKRFLDKTTGKMILPFVRSIFPEAKVIWIDRDPRAVVHSMYRHKSAAVPLSLLRRGGYEPLPSQNSRWLSIPSGLLFRREELEYDAERYLCIYSQYREHRNEILTILYEDFVRDPREQLARILDYCELSPSNSINRALDRWQIQTDTNSRWKDQLNEDEVATIEKILSLPLSEMGYS